MGDRRAQIAVTTTSRRQVLLGRLVFADDLDRGIGHRFFFPIGGRQAGLSGQALFKLLLLFLLLFSQVALPLRELIVWLGQWYPRVLVIE